MMDLVLHLLFKDVLMNLLQIMILQLQFMMYRSCQGAFGCMLSNYIEYNELALIDNGSCLTEIVFGCIDDGSSNDGSDDYHFDLDGDGLPAYNFNSLANTNDSSCYPIIKGLF